MMLSALLLMLAQAAQPTPVVYLTCVTRQGQGAEKHWDITLNEAAGTVDYYTEISGHQRRTAQFTSEAVYFIGFTLNRVDLTIQRRAFDEIESGTCRLAEPPARAF